MNIKKVFIANRGEIALRIIRACRLLGIETVLAVSEADKNSLPARMADRVVCIGPANVSASYLHIPAIIQAALHANADAIHPGYGFLAESPQLARACLEHGLIFVGPKPEHIEQMGNKLQSRALAKRCGIPILSGSKKINSYQEAEYIVKKIGLPVIVKAAAGGGGRGMKIVTDATDLKDTYEAATAEAQAAFGDGTLYVERYIANARHIEVQILGDKYGNIIHLGDRDCSLQRRHQKLIEEAPAPAIHDALRREIHEAAIALAAHIAYENAGTVEFIVDQDTEKFYFLEMNTRIQVEHPVTEAITGIDIVQEQLLIAAGEKLRYSQSEIRFHGHAIECRINCESPADNFRPLPGTITAWEVPLGPGIRLDTHCYLHYQVPIFYDSLLAKLIVHGKNREQAARKMKYALAELTIGGIPTTSAFLRNVIASADFASVNVNTRLLENMIENTIKQ